MVRSGCAAAILVWLSLTASAGSQTNADSWQLCGSTEAILADFARYRL